MTRASRWDRPSPPRDGRWLARLVGKILIATGVLMFGFVGYQLWGTGIEYAVAQNRAENEFAELMAAASTAPTTRAPPGDTTVSTTSAAPTTTATPRPGTTTIPTFDAAVAAMNITDSSPIAQLEIPSIDLDVIMVAGVSREDLQKGPGHFPNTPMPGQLGNAAVAGHRTTYGHPFLEIDQIAVGDEIVVTTPYGRFVYVMTSSEIVDPSAIEVIATTDPTIAELTLTSCHPAYSAAQRIIIHAELDLARSTAPSQPIFNYGRDQPAPAGTGIPGEVPAPVPTATAEPTTRPSTTLPEASTSTTGMPTTSALLGSLETVTPGGGGQDRDSLDGDEDGFSNRWFSDEEAFPHVALWAGSCVAIAVAAYHLAKRVRNSWVGLAAGFGPFVVALYFFYENANRLLPAAL